ncbi:GNAT family N-acetyltransferase [Kribbella turkmenica]|uniref:GNAT family N-acetyltransferase n=1 Tax=Kribbella turkmenica TaxID=2530375 RepID=A0A4R4XH70_9ACTN|nr:GNAT family N-acetyltransferase [Kribbella turkmenica]TDD30114.1 GNAT family N-acetyltransferase [Kribbella turkmenica]
MEVRSATETDVDAAVRTLTRAFEDYPMTRTSLDPDQYLDRLARYQRLFLTRIGMPHGRVWVTSDVSAVAVWTTPATPPNAFAPHAEAFKDLAGSRAALAAEYEQAMGIFRPQSPVWFLALVGVDPSRQQQGLGRAVINPGLAAADAEHSPAFVETQEPANLTFYESLGFTVVAELELPHRGPIHYAMYRPAH